MSEIIVNGDIKDPAIDEKEKVAREITETIYSALRSWEENSKGVLRKGSARCRGRAICKQQQSPRSVAVGEWVLPTARGGTADRADSHRDGDRKP